MFNSSDDSRIDRPVSWAFSDDILDRNIDQLDRETPRCNLSEEEEELERNKLAVGSQNQSPAIQASGPGIPNTWMAQNCLPKTISTQPVSSYANQTKTNPTSPHLNRANIDSQSQSKDAGKQHLHSSLSASVLPVSSITSASSITHSASFNGVSNVNSRIGYASPTSMQNGHQIMSQIRSPRQHHISSQSSLSTSSYHSTSQMGHHVSSASKMPVSHARSLPVTSLPAKPLPSKSLPVTSLSAKSLPSKSLPVTSLPGKSLPVTSLPLQPPIGSTVMHQQNKPLGMVTPQMPNKMGHQNQATISPQISNFSQSKVSLSNQPPTAPSTKMSPKDGTKSQGQQTKSTTSQTAKVVPQKQVYRPLANCTNDQLKRMHGHVEAFCRIPNCQGCQEVRKLKDDPAKKAQLIRQVEDEILLRSRELDSCWQEDELDCVRDFTDMDRRKEMTYAETSEEGIFKRVSDEIIKRPPPWHDDEVDSVKDYSERKGQEGEVSKVGSEEKVCLSPPWNEEEEELLAREPGVAMAHQIKPITSSLQITEAAKSLSASSGCVTTTSCQMPFYMKYNNFNEIDSVKDYTSTYNNGQELGSRIPSSERISLTPPWTPSGCQTPAEGVPLLEKVSSSASENTPSSQSSKETSAMQNTPLSAGKIDTSGVQMRNKTRNNRTAQCAPYVVPRFDDLEEDSVKDYSAPSRQLQELSSKMPSYEYLPFTPPWISNNNSGMQTPLDCTLEYNHTPATSQTSSTTSAVTASEPAMSSKSSAVNEPQAVPPVLSNFRNDRMYYDTYGENNTGVDSVRNFSMGLMEETSRIPSSEQLCFTPPWMESEEVPDNVLENANSEQSGQELTLEEQRAIEEEARKAGTEEAEAKAHEQRKSQSEAVVDASGQPVAAAGLPGRDSGFCSEQDQKQKQQQQQNEENGITVTEGDKPNTYQVQFKQDQCIINPDNKDKDDVTGSPDRCWSSKESSGSNQTDISTIVNPATSVPITAPASPDPNGSEATNTDVSDNEANGQEPTPAAKEHVGDRMAAPQQPEKNCPQGHMIDDKNQYGYPMSMKYKYQHALPQVNQSHTAHHTFPRASMNGEHYYKSYNDAIGFEGCKPNTAYQTMQQTFGNEIERPRMQVPPYASQYQPRDQMDFARGQPPPSHNMRYSSMHYPGLRHPSHPQMHPEQQHQMAFQVRGQASLIHQGQRLHEINTKGQSHFYASQIRGNEQQGSGVTKPGYVGRPVQLDAGFSKHAASAQENFKNVHQQGLLSVAQEQRNSEDKAAPQQPVTLRSISQTNLQQNQEQQQQQQQNNVDNVSVVSFSSMAASHQNLDTKVEMVSSLLSMLGTHDKDDVARTLLAMSSSTDSCSAMRQSGCLPLLIKLLHDPAYESQGINWEARNRAGLALHNIINSGRGDRKGRREVRVLRLIEIVRAHSEALLSGNMEKYQAHRSTPALREHGPGPAVAALMKLSFEEEHKNTISELGGLQVIAELLQVDYKLNGQCNDPYSITLRKYAGMALINLTYSDGKNKNTLLELNGALRAIVTGLASFEEEDLVQVSAGIIRNISWRCDEEGKRVLSEIGAARSLMLSCQNIRSEGAIRSVLSAVWNLSAHSSENKEYICSTQGSLQFLCYALNYRSPNRSLVIPENAGGILRNISSHIAIKPEHREILREHGCLKVLISQLRSPSTRVVSNACGILWNLSARCIEDQELLWELGAVSMLKTLVNSKHKSISTSSASALRNLMAVKPGSSSTDNESHASFQFRRSNTLPGKGRAQNSQNNLRNERKYKSFFGKKNQTKEPNQNTNQTAAKKPVNRQHHEDTRKLHRKVKQGEPHFYADLYQDPPRRGMTMPHTKDPTTILYSHEYPQHVKEASNEGIAMPFTVSHVERWNNTQGSCNCKHGAQYKAGCPVGNLQQGLKDMNIREESPFIARQRRDSSSSSSSFSPPVQQPAPLLHASRVNTDNSPLAIFRDRKPNSGLSAHRRSMSDTISECGHPMPAPQPIHAVTDSELAKRDIGEFNSVTFRRDEHSSWHDLIHRGGKTNQSQAPVSMKNATRELFELQDLSNNQHRNRNARMIHKSYEEVTHYETHFLSPYDDCPLSVVKDVIKLPNPSVNFRSKAEYFPATPKVFVQETRYDVRQAYHRRSNETIASSLHSSQEELLNHCKHNHQGTSVWQCDCYESGNVWIRQRGDKLKHKSGKREPNGQNTACGHHWVVPNGASGSSEYLMSHADESRYDIAHGNDPRMPVKEKIISSPQGQFGLATPLKDPYLTSGSEMAMIEAMSKEGICLNHGDSHIKDKTSGEMTDGNVVAKKPLRSSLKTPSESLRKFRKKHVTQKVVTSVDKKKERSKDNLMVTSL